MFLRKNSVTSSKNKISQASENSENRAVAKPSGIDKTAVPKARGTVSYSNADQSHKPLCRQMFDKYDTDGSGDISITEFRKLCYDMGYYLSDLELDMDIKLLDQDGDGEISYSEFIKWWENDDRFKLLQLTPDDYLRLAKACSYFQRFDKDGSGQIDIREFRSLYVDMVKKKLAKKSMTATMEELDRNRDGKISFNEYVHWLIEGNILNSME